MYKIQILWSLFLIILLNNALAKEDGKEKEAVTYRFVPTVYSNPTSGTGAGIAALAIYNADKNSSASQGLISGKYTNTNSYSLSAINKMFFKSDTWQSKSVFGYMNNNSDFSIPSDILPPFIPDFFNPEDGIQYNVKIYTAMQQFMYKPKPNLYFGGQLYYVDQKFSGQNVAGEIFLKGKGIKNSTRGGYGVVTSYDTRAKKEKIYPSNSVLVDLTVSHFPEFLGIDEQYYNVSMNARKYISGFKSTDVFAMQFYGQYSSDDTPDGALSALGARNILRGFPSGLYKARHMVAGQGEYRYRINATRFRLTAFAGYANLSGGSKGTNTGNRDNDNGSYYSGGVGVHYILVEERKIDYRINVAYTNDHEASVYVNINQAF